MKVYWWIIFSNIIVKVLKFIITKQILYFAKINGFLFSNNFKAYHSNSIKYTLYYFIENFYIFQNKKKIVTIFFLDLIKVFNNIINS